MPLNAETPATVFVVVFKKSRRVGTMMGEGFMTIDFWFKNGRNLQTNPASAIHHRAQILLDETKRECSHSQALFD